MANLTEIRTSVDADITAEASAIFEAAGFTLSDVVRMMLLRTVAERGLPFDPLVPNAETIEAMLASRRGDVVRMGSFADLMNDLHADD